MNDRATSVPEGPRNRAGDLIDISQVKPDELRRHIILKARDKLTDKLVMIEPKPSEPTSGVYQLKVKPKVSELPSHFEWTVELEGTLDYIWGML